MRGDAHAGLLRLLLARGGAGCRLVASRQRQWASITFEGARHIVELALPAEAVGVFLHGIEEAEFDLADHLLADLAATGASVAADGLSAVRIEALTLLQR